MAKSRLRVLALFLCFAIAFPLVACRKKEKKKTSAASFSEYYSTTNTIMSIPNVMKAGFCGDGAFALTYCETEEYLDAYHKQSVPSSGDTTDLPYLPLDDEGKEIAPESLLYYLDEKGEIKATYDLNEETRPSQDIRNIYCTDDACWVLTSRVDKSAGVSEYFVDCFDPEKGVTKHIDLDLGSYRGVVFGFEVGEDGNFVLTCMGDRGFMMIPGGSFEVTGGNDKVFMLDKDGKLKEEIALPETYASGSAVTWKGSLTCMGAGKELPQVLFKYDEKNKTWTETDIAVTEGWNKLLVRNSDLFSIETSKIVRLDEKETSELKLEEVSVWGHVDDIRFLENGEIELLVMPMSDDMCILYHLAPSDKKTQESKKEFVIAGYNLIESPIPQLVEEISILHPEVKFVMRDYMEELEASGKSGRKDLYELVSLDIANGRAPDMYFDCFDDISLGEMGRLGYLKDLTPYLETLNEDDYFMEKITMGKKTPYCASLTYWILAFEASPEYVENTDTWTYDDFYRCAGKFTDLTCIQSVYSKESLLKYGVLAQMDVFTAGGEANFTGDDFLKLLKWTNDIGRKEDWEDYTNAELDDGLFMLDYQSIDSPGKVIDLKDHVLVGFPNENGALHAVPNYLLAISATTSQDELAGEIIRHALSEQFQSNCPAMSAGTMMVNRKCWEQDFEESYKLYTESYPEKLKLSKEEYHDMALQTISRADRYLHGYKSVVDVVLEEAAAYYSGTYSAEHVAELIQNRVNTYLKETNS